MSEPGGDPSSGISSGDALAHKFTLYYDAFPDAARRSGASDDPWRYWHTVAAENGNCSEMHWLGYLRVHRNTGRPINSGDRCTLPVQSPYTTILPARVTAFPDRLQ